MALPASSTLGIHPMSSVPWLAAALIPVGTAALGYGLATWSTLRASSRATTAQKEQQEAQREDHRRQLERDAAAGLAVNTLLNEYRR